MSALSAVATRCDDLSFFHYSSQTSTYRPENKKTFKDILLKSEWVLKNGYPYYRCYFGDGRYKEQLACIICVLLNARSCFSPRFFVDVVYPRRPVEHFKSTWGFWNDEQRYLEIKEFLVAHLSK